MKIGQTSYEKGIEKGIDRGQTELLLKMLHKRLGPLNEATQQRVQAMTSEQREAFVETLVTASSLRELGLDG